MGALQTHVSASPENASGARPRFVAVDLFCGAGGTTQGLIQAGGYVCAGVDNDASCRRTYRANNQNRFSPFGAPEYLQYDLLPASDIHPEGAQNLARERLEAILRRARITFPDLPLLFVFTPPCQPFTRLGKGRRSDARAQLHSVDSGLLLHSVNFVRWFLPDALICENVPGISNEKYGGVWQGFIFALEQLGYLVGSRSVCASKFGVPQYRRRSILVAVRRSVARLEVTAAGGLTLPGADPHATTVTVKQAIGHLPPLAAGEQHPEIPNHRARRLSQVNVRRLQSVRPGENNNALADTDFGDLSLDCHSNMRRSGRDSGFTDVYMRMEPNKPSPTITTKCHSISNGRFGHFDVRQARAISLREAALLQSFPADYVFYPTSSMDSVARMIGNAVPPKLARFFAQWILDRVDFERIRGLRTK